MSAHVESAEEKKAREDWEDQILIALHRLETKGDPEPAPPPPAPAPAPERTYADDEPHLERVATLEGHEDRVWSVAASTLSV